ncbi:hypothetical protein H0H87_004697 [Tephrocybe sp. NHM501043]|nr:hypothetical protein H0H87_004697 [Tephrocybe sp. NHM501043]
MEIFSSVKERPRDKILQDKQQKELAEKDKKIERLQRANNESWKRHFDAQNRGNQLAQALGFHDIFEAQVAIDIAGHEIPYKECFERVEMLQEQLAKVRAKNESLHERVASLETHDTENKAREGLAAENQVHIPSLEVDQTRRAAENKLEQELAQLQGRFDALLDVKERAAKRYKSDYAKWKEVKIWFFEEEAEIAKNVGGSEEEKRKRYHASLMSKKKLMKEIAAGAGTKAVSFIVINLDISLEPTSTPYSRPPPLGGITNFQADKENQKTPTRPTLHTASERIPPLQNKLLDAVSHPRPPSSSPNLFNEGSLPIPPNQRPSSSPSDGRQVTSPRTSPTVVGTASKSLRNRVLDSVMQRKQFSSPATFESPSSSRQPLNFESIKLPPSPQIHQETGSSPSAKHDAFPSSDTEEDSQVLEMGPPLLPTSPAPMLSSETEADSQSQIFPFPFLDPTPCPARPTKPMLAPTQPTSAKPTFPRGRRVVSSRDSETMQALKARRVSDENDAEVVTPRPRGHELHSGSGKGKEREIGAPMSTPANPPPSTKRIEDYSAYKGRGRYGNTSTAPKETINAQFEIDPARNGGLDFQYDEVVRNKEDRRRMDAGDCECCRDYYEAVGPLPKRLQAPLWKSPPSTPAKPCPHHAHLSASGSKGSIRTASTADSSGGRERHQSEISSHKQAISRHRHHWDRAKTPPMYWNIGFPNTQETEEINEQAKKMHQKKRDEVEAAVRREDGRYRRRS